MSGLGGDRRARVALEVDTVRRWNRLIDGTSVRANSSNTMLVLHFGHETSGLEQTPAVTRIRNAGPPLLPGRHLSGREDARVDEGVDVAGEPVVLRWKIECTVVNAMFSLPRPSPAMK